MARRPQRETQRPAAPKPEAAESGSLRRLGLILAAVALVVAFVGFAAWKLRDSPEDLAKLAPVPEAADQASGGKIGESLGFRDSAQCGARRALAIGYRAAVLLQAPSEPGGVKTYVGKVVWRKDLANRGPNQQLSSAIRSRCRRARRKDRARRTLARIGGAEYADSELREVLTTLQAHAQPIEARVIRLQSGEAEAPRRLKPTPQRLSLKSARLNRRWAEILSPGIRKVLGIGIFLAVLQQWSGINVLFNYAEEIYRNAGYGVSDTLFNIVISGTINLVFTLVAMAFVDRLGRRVLMLAGCLAIAACHTAIGLAYYFGLKGLPVLVCTLAAIGCYAMTLAPVTWVLIAEIFPNRIRGAAVSVSVSALWIACFALTFTFPVLNRALGPAGTFGLYAAICFLGFLFVLAQVPETKGKALEQIEKECLGG